MSINLGHALYTTAMILLAFVAALVVTKTLFNYIEKRSEKKEEGKE